MTTKPRRNFREYDAQHARAERELLDWLRLRVPCLPLSPHRRGDPTITEVLVNPDGRLWIDRLQDTLTETGEHLSPA